MAAILDVDNRFFWNSNQFIKTSYNTWTMNIICPLSPYFKFKIPMANIFREIVS